MLSSHAASASSGTLTHFKSLNESDPGLVDASSDPGSDDPTCSDLSCSGQLLFEPFTGEDNEPRKHTAESQGDGSGRDPAQTCSNMILE